MTTDPQQHLEYAPPPPLRRRMISRILVAAVAFLIGATCVYQAPRLWHKTSLYYWQQKCLSHAQSDKTVVAQFEIGSMRKSIVPAEWSTLYAKMSPPGIRSDGTVFLHELRSRSGNRRLVAVDVSAASTYLGFGTRTIKPGTPLTEPKLLSSEFTAGNWPSSNDRSFTVYAGQIDPEDPSHFTFRVNQSGQDMIFDGWLRDDDGAVIELRQPAIPPAPASAGQPR